MYGDISAKAAYMLSLPEVIYFKQNRDILSYSYFLVHIISIRIIWFFPHPFQVSDFFTRLIQRVVPKSYQQAFGEVYVTRKFLENFSGDQVLVISPVSGFTNPQKRVILLNALLMNCLIVFSFSWINCSNCAIIAFFAFVPVGYQFIPFWFH